MVGGLEYVLKQVLMINASGEEMINKSYSYVSFCNSQLLLEVAVIIQ